MGGIVNPDRLSKVLAKVFLASVLLGLVLIWTSGASMGISFITGAVSGTLLTVGFTHRQNKRRAARPMARNAPVRSDNRYRYDPHKGAAGK